MSVLEVVAQAESLVEASTTTPDEQTYLSLSFTPKPNTDYLVIGSAEMRVSNLGDGCWQFKNSTSGRLICMHQGEHYLHEYYSMFGAELFEFEDSPAEQTIIWGFCERAGSGAIYMTNGRIVVIELPPFHGIQRVANDDLLTTTSTDYVDIVSVTLGPPVAQDYIILSCGIVCTANSANRVYQRLVLDDSAISGEQVWHRAAAAAIMEVNAHEMAPVALTTSLHTIKSQFKSGTGGTVKADDQRLLVLPSTLFSSRQSVTANSDTTSSASLVSVGEDLTYTPSSSEAAMSIMSCSLGPDTEGTGMGDYRTALYMDGIREGRREVNHSAVSGTWNRRACGAIKLLDPVPLAERTLGFVGSGYGSIAVEVQDMRIEVLGLTLAIETDNMAWQTEMVDMLRYIINDNGTPQEFSDDRLQSLLAAAGQLVLGVADFPKSYSIEISAANITPDPTAATRDNAFINLTVLKAACLLATGEFRQDSNKGIMVKDGPSTVDTRTMVNAKKELMNDVCAAYADAELKYRAESRFGLGSPGEAVVGPHRSGSVSSRSYLDRSRLSFY